VVAIVAVGTGGVLWLCDLFRINKISIIVHKTATAQNYIHSQGMDGRCILVKILLINHQDGRNRDIITIFFPINSRTRVFSGLYASYKRFAWKICS
jgi:hypothetical protein